MINEKLVKIGATQKPHGLKGELKVYIEDQYEEDFEQCETVFLTISGKTMPYFIEEIRGGNATIVKFEDIDNIDDASRIAKRDLFLRESDLIPDEMRTAPLVESFDYLDGYTMIDKNEGTIGVIKEIIEMPEQEMAVVEYKNRERYVPLNEHFVTEVKDKEKIVYVDLPEGLLDL